MSKLFFSNSLTCQPVCFELAKRGVFKLASIMAKQSFELVIRPWLQIFFKIYKYLGCGHKALKF